MSKDRIKKVAIQHFNQYGYHGVRMAQVAGDAGIRKQTLAYHFSSKLELFKELYRDVVEEEIAFVREFFLINTEFGWENCLYQFLIDHKNRFTNNSNANFMFVISFLPPVEAHDFVMSEYRRYMGILKEKISLQFAQEQKARLTPEECTLAYITFLDGLDVQLVYENADSYERALEIGWRVLLLGIRNKG